MVSKRNHAGIQGLRLVEEVERTCKICGQKCKTAKAILNHYSVEELCNHGLERRG